MRLTHLLVVTTCCLLTTPLLAADKTGSISGQVLLKGDVPAPVLQIKKGDATVKDAAVCAAMDMLAEDLVVDAESKGIANVFIYMRKAPKGVKFDAPKDATLVFDQENCRFYPHALIVRTDQKVNVISSDNCAHNFHTYPIKNAPLNVLMAPNDKKGIDVEFDGAEILPMKVGCDIHSWMTAWWMVVDHPFAAVTNAKGEFTIEGLPEGEHEFRIWHEKAGYLEKSYEVKVKAGKVTELKALEVPLSKFE